MASGAGHARRLTIYLCLQARLLREALQTQGSKGALAFLAQMQSGEERASAEARVHDARKKSAMAALLSPPPVGPAAGALARLKGPATRSCRPLAPAPTPTPAPLQNPNPWKT